MKLQELFQGVSLPKQIAGSIWMENPAIKDLAYDSRKAKEGVLFFAVPGFTVDGAKFVPGAFASGAIGAVVQDLSAIDPQFHSRCILVRDVREALALASANFFQHPTRDLLVVGVTGTKGKTTTTFLLESIFAAAGKKTALLGTVECRYPGKRIEAKRTTMESYDLQAFLREAKNAGAEVAILEVSSHALSLHRVKGVKFDGALFLNLMPDHLDFHKDMEDYFMAKSLLFTQYPGKGVTNLDNEYGARLLKLSKIPVKSFGKEGDYSSKKLVVDAKGIRGKVALLSGKEIMIESSFTGAFNISNLMAAIALADQLGVPGEKIAEGIRNLPVVAGRLERVQTKLPFQVFVDFAHMPPALENVLESLRPVCEKRLIVVFGAGGDRPVERREMGGVAARLADYTVITSDNPRTEDPAKIIATIEQHYLSETKRLNKEKKYSIEADRRKAIALALHMARAGDVICIAGKGHETGQTIGTQTFPFDDREEAKKILEDLEKKSPN